MVEIKVRGLFFDGTSFDLVVQSFGYHYKILNCQDFSKLSILVGKRLEANTCNVFYNKQIIGSRGLNNIVTLVEDWEKLIIL